MKRYVIKVETDYKPITLIDFSSSERNAKLKARNYLSKVYPRRIVKKITVLEEKKT